MATPRAYRWRDRDAARRMADVIALHQTMLSVDELVAGRYVAIRLSDGGSDGTAYTSRAEAATYQKHNASRCGYYRIPIPPDRLPAEVCDVLLWYVRGCYDAGSRQDPAHQIILPTRIEDMT